ncbi:MAG: hypothetical protein IKW52_06685 [Alistipes sp.]|nr:hypothetical protein [Alistipes sp.]
MKIKNRYSIWNLRFVAWNKAQQRLKRRNKGFKLSFSDILISVSGLLLVNADGAVANLARKGVEWQIAAEWTLLAIFFLGLFLKFRRKAPRPCWTRMSWGLSMMAVACTVIAYVLWWTGDFTIEEAQVMELCCSPLYVAALASILRLRYIRRRSRAEIAMMRMRRSRRRSYNY